jgi:predicted lipoprotein with Yx(FWY)xxD motif
MECSPALSSRVARQRAAEGSRTRVWLHRVGVEHITWLEEKIMGRTKSAVLVTLVAAGALASPAAVASTNTSSSISLRTTKVGKVLVVANGRTLYLFTADKSETSACYGKCAVFWPPLIAERPTAGAGLKASLLGTTKRRGGKLQVTYGGHPLYFFAEDRKAGDVNGQGFVHFGGTWRVVSAAGKRITATP